MAASEKKTAGPPVIVIVGPTAAGKSAVALQVAQKLGGVIVSADSRQFYRWMQIGTDRPGPEALAAVPHYFVDFLDPREEYSAGQYARDAREKIAELRKEGRRVVVVGGSGMYVQALLDGFFEPAVRDPQVKEQLKRRAEEEGAEALYEELRRIDPQRAAELHPNDVHRIVRALEVYYVSGRRFSELRQLQRMPADFPFAEFGITWPRPLLYERIERRVDEMVARGLEHETRGLLAMGVSPRANAFQSLGYREMLEFVRGERTLAEAEALIKQHTRNFAKRQLTWFRRDPRIRWIEVHRPEELKTAAETIVAAAE